VIRSPKVPCSGRKRSPLVWPGWHCWRHRLAWAPAVLVAAGSLVVLVGTVYVNVPAVGPFPPLYEPAWFGEKVVAVASAAAALTAAASGAALYRLTAGPAGPAASRL